MDNKLENKTGTIKINIALEAITAEYKSEFIKLLSNKILATTILMLNLTESPIPNKTKFLTPSSFLATRKLSKIFAPLDIIIIKIINKG